MEVEGELFGKRGNKLIRRTSNGSGRSVINVHYLYLYTDIYVYKCTHRQTHTYIYIYLYENMIVKPISLYN